LKSGSGAGSRRLSALTLLLLLIGVGCGVGLGAALVHSLQNTQQAVNAPAPPTARPILGVVVDEGLTVLTVDSGGAAEHAGIRSGDVLTALDGVSFNAAAEVRPALTAALKAHPERSLQISLTRAGRSVVVAVQVDAGPAPSRTGTAVASPTPPYGVVFYL
jgi:S1-C subfamily serine protease